MRVVFIRIFNHELIKMKYFICLFVLFWSCSIQTAESKRIKNTMGKELKLEMFKTLFLKGDIVSYESFQKTYRYKYIVYLLDECSPCYEKYIQWHKEMKEIDVIDNFTILFIIKGKYVEDFIKQVELKGHVEEKYYIVMDPNYIYQNGNTEIPAWMLELPLLIDEDNKIKMVGSPFLNSKSLKRFRRIVSQ